jgi:hypothetical protein
VAGRPDRHEEAHVLRPRTLIASDFNAGNRAHFALSYEFCRIIGECDNAEIVAPGIYNYITKYFGAILPTHDGHSVQRDFNRMVNGLRKRVKLKNLPAIEPNYITGTYDIFVYVAWSPQSLVELPRIRNWRGQCKIAVLYLVELWASTVEADSRYLKLLDQFDHVFMVHTAAIPLLSRFTPTPCSFLPTAVDCLAASPYPLPPDRVIDVYSMGSRSRAVHQQLLAMARSQRIFYVYDTLSSSDSLVQDWFEHRLFLASMIKRSRYFMAFTPAALDTKATKAAGEQVLPARLFEGAAGGTVMLGAAPKCAEFETNFDWPDAVIEAPGNTGNIADLIEELDSQPGRTEQIRQTNAVQCLLRHDWAHRWEQILSTIGMEALPQLRERKALLNETAAAIPKPLRLVAGD